MRLTLVPFAAVAFGLSFSGQALAQAAPPAGWTCNAAFFDTDDGCDCGCGVADPDCATPAFASCEFDQCPDEADANTVPVEGAPITCAANACGDGTVDGDEACDDNNNTANDGCSATCTVETGFICERPSSGTTGFRRLLTSACRVVVCGDGFIDGDEDCDDDNAAANDGCSATCTQEAGFDCNFAEPTVCVPVVCGDSLVNGDEDCDDGNAAANDGCDAACAEEAGFACITPGAACVPIICGDSSIDGDERCDDGNAAAGDGCSATCTEEDGFACPAAGQACIAIPDGWTCTDSFFGSDDGCECGCGVADPDCPSARLEDCGVGGGIDGCGAGEIDPNDTTQCIGGGGEGEGEGEGEPAEGEGEGEPAEGEGEGEPAEGEGEGEGEPAGFCGAAPASTLPMAGLMAALMVVGRRRRR